MTPQVPTVGPSASGSYAFDTPVSGPAGAYTVNVSLVPQRDISLAGLAHGFIVRNAAATVHFTSAPGMAPTIQDEALPGVTCAAWLKGLTAKQGQPVQLGTITVTPMPSTALPTQLWLDVSAVVADELPNTRVVFSTTPSVRLK